MSTADSYAVSPGWGVLMTDLGIAPAMVLRRAGLPADLFSREPTSLTPEQYVALWQALDEEADDPDLPVRIGRTISVEAFDPPIFAALCSRDLSLAATRIATYKKLIGPMRLAVTATESGTRIECRWPNHTPLPELMTTTELVFWVALARLGTRVPVRPVQVTSPQVPRAHHALEDYFGVRVRRADSYAVTFSPMDAARPFVTANDKMWQFFEPELRRRLSQLERGATMQQRVQAALLELLPSGQGSVDAVARDLAVSSRTLQRQLKGEGTTFQRVLGDTRESLARHYLSEGHMTAAEISFLLGYEDPSSFYRAFHTWTGMTPQRMRLAAV